MTDEYEIDPELMKLEEEAERLGAMREHFKKPLVTEHFLRDFEEKKTELKLLEANLEVMKKAIEASRMPGEKQLILGRMAAFFEEIDGTDKVDWEAMFHAVNGKPAPELLAQYTKPGRKGYTKVSVKSLGS